MHGDNMLYLGKIRSEIDTMLAFPCGEAIVDHALQQRLHVIVETVEIVENARLRQGKPSTQPH